MNKREREKKKKKKNAFIHRMTDIGVSLGSTAELS